MKVVVLFVLFFCNSNSYALRVISLMPSYTEIIFELNSQKDLVGISSFSDWPPEASSITKIGDYYRPDIEKIYLLKPDIIFTGQWESFDLSKKINSKNIAIVYIPEEKKIKDIIQTIKIISQHLKKSKDGEILANKFNQEIENLNLKNKGKNKKVFIEIDSGLWTCGKNSFINDVVKISGGENIFDNIEKDYFKVNWEAILNKNPDIIISLSTQPDYFYKLALSDKVKAVKNREVYKLPEEERNIISRPSPRILKVIKRLNEIYESK